jgi:hypothetical protein
MNILLSCLLHSDSCILTPDSFPLFIPYIKKVFSYVPSGIAELLR